MQEGTKQGASLYQTSNLRFLISGFEMQDLSNFKMFPFLIRGIHHPASMKSKQGLLWIAGAFLLPLTILWGLYALEDPETRDLNAATRAGVSGAFAQLGDGYTHYELGGPENGSRPVVVLAAGFSVPYYIWDPTFKALTGAGFRVLRYDYYGRGYSDRPAIAFSDEMYVRQLEQLLNGLQL